jgi:carbamoyltransferase
MKVLGISGSERDAAAALSVDGVLVAAAAEESFARVPQIGYRATGGYPLAAIHACLTRANIRLADIERLAIVDDGVAARLDHYTHGIDGVGTHKSGHEHRALALGLQSKPFDCVDPLLADARQLEVVCEGENLSVCVLASELGQSAAFERRQGEWAPVPGFGNAGELFVAVARMTEAVGLGATASYDALERFGSEPAPEYLAAFERALTWDAERGVVLDRDRFGRTFAGLPGGEDADRQDWSLNVRVQQERQAIAASFCRRVATIVEDMARDLSARTGVGRVGFAGGLFASRGLVAALARAFGDGMCVPPVPELSGRALGAAIGVHTAACPPLLSLALGPQFSESEIKETLENCRLEYLYEPDRHKLATRISRMLARGSVVAWFQGAAGFGPRPVGTRSVLCDPSNRYARENVNRFLRQAPLDDPLPLAMTCTAMREALDCPGGSPFLGAACPVKPEWRDRLRAALTAQGTALVQMTTPDQCEELTDLLSVHRDLTGVPGLIQTSLAGVDEPTACTPRDAVRSMFSSAIDALVIGRFLLMKDYWMLRSGSDVRDGR